MTTPPSPAPDREALRETALRQALTTIGFLRSCVATGERLSANDMTDLDKHAALIRAALSEAAPPSVRDAVAAYNHGLAQGRAEAAPPSDPWGERNADDREADAFRAGLAQGRAEAAPPSGALDVDRLAVALWGMDLSTRPDAQKMAQSIAAEYARLSTTEPTETP